MTALSPLASLITALQAQLTTALAVPEPAPAPFLDVFDGVMAEPEPKSEPGPHPQPEFRSQTGSDGKSLRPAPKAKKAPESDPLVVQTQVLVRPDAAPLPQPLPTLPVVPVMPAAVPIPQEAQVTAPAPCQDATASQDAPARQSTIQFTPAPLSTRVVAAPPTSAPVEPAGPELPSRAAGSPTVREPDRRQPVSVAEVREPKLTGSELPVAQTIDFHDTLHDVIQADRPQPQLTKTDRSDAAPLPAPPPAPQAQSTKAPELPAAPVQPRPTSEVSPPPAGPEEIWLPPVPNAKSPKTPAPTAVDVSAPKVPPAAAHTTPVPVPDAAPDRPRPRARVDQVQSSQSAAVVHEVPAADDFEPPVSTHLAFAAKLIPDSGDPAPAQPLPRVQPKPDAKFAPERQTVQPPPAEESTAAPAPKAEMAEPVRDRKVAPPDPPRERRSAAPEAPSQTPEPIREAGGDTRAALAVSSREPAASEPKSAAEPEQTPAAPRTVLPHDVTRPAASPAPVRDIRLDLSGGDRRVEVRLMERGGEVHLAVRTPDPQLAGALRENLPSLTARLEQTGMRTEAWHGGTDAATEKRTVAAESSRGESGDTRERSQSQNGEQKDEHPRRSRETQEQSSRRTKGTSFSWFMPSHT